MTTTKVSFVNETPEEHQSLNYDIEKTKVKLFMGWPEGFVSQNTTDI